MPSCTLIILDILFDLQRCKLLFDIIITQQHKYTTSIIIFIVLVDYHFIINHLHAICAKHIYLYQYKWFFFLLQLLLSHVWSKKQFFIIWPFQWQSCSSSLYNNYYNCSQFCRPQLFEMVRHLWSTLDVLYLNAWRV